MTRLQNLTVKVSFVGDFEMLFGNSYKSWDCQLKEFCTMGREVQVPTSIVYSILPWVSYGGLKWCAPENFQEQLDDEGDGRQASSFAFGNPPANVQSVFEKLRREVQAAFTRRQLRDAAVKPVRID